MNATKEQKFAIRKNCKYNEDIKEEFVQWATGDTSKTSLNDLTFEEANKIIAQQTGKNTSPTLSDAKKWGAFNKKHPKHRVILSLLYQAQWTEPSDKYGEIPDTERFGEWLRSDKSPVKKPLKDMEDFELEKVIKAFGGIVKSRYK